MSGDKPPLTADEVHHYHAFGLTIGSAVPLRGFPPADGPADVEVRYGRVPYDRGQAPPAHPLVFMRPGDAIFYWDFVGAVRIQGGSQITVDRLPQSEDDAVGQAIIGVAMGTLLYQREVFTLHASAVAIGDAVVAFIGVKGAGKSTAAATLYARGHRLVTDDIVALRIEGDPPQASVFPGTNAFKLWPQAAAASLGDDPGTLPELYANAIKRLRPADPGRVAPSLPLGCVYLLKYADSMKSGCGVETVPPQQACLELVQHSYAQRMLGASAWHGQHLQQCAHLARMVPMKRLSRRRALDELELFAETIERDAAAL